MMGIFTRKNKGVEDVENTKTQVEAPPAVDESQNLSEENLEELNAEAAAAEEVAEEVAEPEEVKADEPSLEEMYTINEKLQERLFTALVELDGRLADPSDVPFNPDFLENPEALDAAITELVKAKPGLKSKKYAGNIGAGNRGSSVKAKPDLISMIRGY